MGEEDRVPTCTSRILEGRSGGQVGLSMHGGGAGALRVFFTSMPSIMERTGVEDLTLRLTEALNDAIAKRPAEPLTAMAAFLRSHADAPPGEPIDSVAGATLLPEVTSYLEEHRIREELEEMINGLRSNGSSGAASLVRPAADALAAPRAEAAGLQSSAAEAQGRVLTGVPYSCRGDGVHADAVARRAVSRRRGERKGPPDTPHTIKTQRRSSRCTRRSSPRCSSCSSGRTRRRRR